MQFNQVDWPIEQIKINESIRRKKINSSQSELIVFMCYAKEKKFSQNSKLINRLQKFVWKLKKCEVFACLIMKNGVSNIKSTSDVEINSGDE